MNGPTELNELRDAVARGAYLVDPLAVADAMLGRGDAVLEEGEPEGDGDGRRSAVLVAGELHPPAVGVEQMGALAFLDAS